MSMLNVTPQVSINKIYVNHHVHAQHTHKLWLQNQAVFTEYILSNTILCTRRTQI